MLVVRMNGRNDREALGESSRTIEAIASQSGADLVGVQFFDG